MLGVTNIVFNIVFIFMLTNYFDVSHNPSFTSLAPSTKNIMQTTYEIFSSPVTTLKK